MTMFNRLIGGIGAIREERSVCIPGFEWDDIDSGDHFEARATKDGEWMEITRISQGRGEVITFDVPREVLQHIVRQLGGTL